MDHQNMFVGQSMTTLAWKPSLSGGTCDYYLIRSMDGCSDMSPLNMTWRNNRTYTRSFSTDYLANIQGLNRNFNITGSLNGRVCQKLPSSSTTFQINKETGKYCNNASLGVCGY